MTVLTLSTENALHDVSVKVKTLAERYSVTDIRGNLRPALLDTAKAYIGLIEHPNNTGELAEYFDGELKSPHVEKQKPWCLLFVCRVLRDVSQYWGRPDLIPASVGDVRSLMQWAKEGEVNVVSPEVGDIVCWTRKHGDGHLGIITAMTFSSFLKSYNAEIVEGDYYFPTQMDVVNRYITLRSRGRSYKGELILWGYISLRFLALKSWNIEIE